MVTRPVWILVNFFIPEKPTDDSYNKCSQTSVNIDDMAS